MGLEKKKKKTKEGVMSEGKTRATVKAKAPSNDV